MRAGQVSLAQVSGPEALNRTSFLADFITITFVFRVFGTHRGPWVSGTGRSHPGHRGKMAIWNA
jgi:hypothetical protein